MPHSARPLAALAAVLLASVCLLGIRCTPTDASSPAFNADALRAENDALHAELDRLHGLALTQRQQIHATTRLITKTLDDLRAVSTRKGLMRGPEIDPRVQLTADFPRSERSIREAERRVTQHLALISSHLQESAEAVDRLRRRPAAPAPVPGPSPAELQALRTAHAAVATKRDRLQALLDSVQAHAAHVQQALDSLQNAHRILVDARAADRTAYLAIGTADALVERGLLQKRRFRSDRLHLPVPGAYTPVSIDASSLPLPEDARVSIRTLHRQAPALYTLHPDRLEIHDPEAFWALSRYLIVEVR